MRWLAIILILSSCGSSHYLKKAERALKKAEQLGADIKSDTVYIDKEVIVPQTHFDTVLTEVNFRDTITVTKDRVITRVKVNTVEKKIFVETECLPDTVKIQVPVTVTRKISAGYSLWELLILAIAALGVGFAAGRFLKVR
jgi:hypothetical protein